MVKYRLSMCRFLLYIDLRSGLGVDRSAKEYEWEYMKKKSKYSASMASTKRKPGIRGLN